jgi:hypothetical protein
MRAASAGSLLSLSSSFTTQSAGKSKAQLKQRGGDALNKRVGGGENTQTFANAQMCVLKGGGNPRGCFAGLRSLKGNKWGGATDWKGAGEKRRVRKDGIMSSSRSWKF